MKKKQILIIVGMLVMISLLPIIEADYQTKQNNENNTFTSRVYPNESELIITFELSELIQTQITTVQGEFTKIEIPGSGFIGDIGSPKLPMWTRSYAVPTDQISLEILDMHIMEKRQIGRIYPVQKPHADSNIFNESEFIFDESIYQQDVYYPGQIVEITGSGKIRDIPFVKIGFYPVRYNPNQQMAIIYDKIIIKLTFTPGEPVLVEPNYTQKPFYKFYENVFNNWAGFVENANIEQKYSTIKGRGSGCEYLVITHQNFFDEAKELADWKHKKGFIVKVVNVSDIGGSSAQIRQYIQDAYDTWDPKPSYVLLVGDDEYVPTNYIYSAASDLWYATVDGNDYYPDLFIGRIPADTANEAEVIVQKILTYELTPPTLNSFYENFTVAAYFQDDEHNGYETRRFVRTSEEIRDYLMSIGYAGERIYCTENSISPTNYNNGYYGHGEPLPPELLRPTFAWKGDADDIIDAVEQGIFILNHRDHGSKDGWGDPYFKSDHVESLTNGDLTPVVFSINCLTGNFDNYECFSEKFLRKEDGGAVAVFGATRVSYSGYNDFLCRGFYDAIWPDFDLDIGGDAPLYSLGEILNYGKIYMADTWGDTWNVERLTFELFHCFGDPSMEIWTAFPQNLDVTYTTSSGSLCVEVMSGAHPVEEALVCLRQEPEFYVKGLTDWTGEIYFDTSSASFEVEASLVVTAHNYLYYSEDFSLNQKPEKPDRPSGPTEGTPNTEYMYRASTIDLDDDRILYNFSWGDETYSGWVGPFDSGDEASAMHAWDEKGTYDIRVKAKDTKGNESDWSDPLVVSMPMNNAISNPILLWIYNIIINHFPTFGSILQMLF